jgi:F-type H+-transporting ATPase subunit delta
LSANIVSRRYAKALFTVALDRGKTVPTKIGDNMATLGEVLEAAPDLLKVFKSPMFNIDQKKAIISGILAKESMNKTVANFLQLLADKDRLGNLPEIIEYYQALLDEHEGVVRGEVITAGRLTKTKQKDMQGKLEKQLGKKLVLTYATRKAALGGLILKVGDKTLDASLRAQLDILKENIKRGE